MASCSYSYVSEYELAMKHMNVCVCCTSKTEYLVRLAKCKHTVFLLKLVKFKFDMSNSYICMICHAMLRKIAAFKQQVEDSMEMLIDQTHHLQINMLYDFNTKTTTTDSTRQLFRHDINLKSEPSSPDFQAMVKIEHETETNDYHQELSIKHETNDDHQQLSIEHETNDDHQQLSIEHETNDDHQQLSIEHGTNDDHQQLSIEHETNDEHETKKQLSMSDDAEIPLSELSIRKNKKTSIKKKSKSNAMQAAKTNVFDGKLRHIQLSREQLDEEREQMRKNEGYLKLPYKCEDCIVGFDHELTLQNHMDMRHNKSKICHQCDICKATLSNKFTFDAHMRRHVGRVDCVVCGRRYNLIKSAIQHYDEKHAAPGERIRPDFVCKDCGFTTASAGVYHYHMAKHKNKGCECEICGNTYVNLTGLKSHLITVHKKSSRVYKCEPCNKLYRAKSGLAAHVKSVHNEQGRAFCAECSTQFKNEKILLIHLSTHSNHITESDKKYICDECGTKFVKKYDLRVHISWVHLKIKNHRCKKCSKIFKRATDLRRHFNFVHLKQRAPRNKICDYCGRGFSRQTILQSHIRTHTGERPLRCAHCAASFAHSAALYTHNKLLHKASK